MENEIVPLMWILYFYIAAALVLVAYGLNTYHLLYIYYRNKGSHTAAPHAPRSWPRVTVQLPIFNEIHVVEPLLQAVAQLDYPRERLEIQVLDDSNDGTTAILTRVGDEMRQCGIDVSIMHRCTRDGYKAGALREGLQVAKGEIVAIFDADFVPPRDFLRRTVPYFSNPNLGMVQTRWGYSNREYSLLTRVTAQMLDGHFVIEQVALSRARYLFNFNGSAGLWRKSVVEDAGGWSDDTLTEDRDLSYRAQLRGWQFHYLSDLVCDSQLPVTVTAMKAQQARWTKGAAETALKMFWPILGSSLPLRQKLEALLHSGYAVVFLALLIAVLGSLPVALIYGDATARTPILVVVVAMQLSALAYPTLYATSVREAQEDWPLGLVWTPFTLLLGVGLTVSNCKALLLALFGLRTPFVRTPKYSGEAATSTSKQPLLVTGLDVALAIYCISATYVAAVNGLYVMLPLTVWYAAGFLLISGLTLFEAGAEHAMRGLRRSRTLPGD